MYITVSRKANNFVKRFSKYLSLFIDEIKYMPRGKTPLNKIFKSAIFLGHNYLLISRNLEKDMISLLVYKREDKEKDFYPDKEIILRIIEMDSILSQKELTKIRKDYGFVDKDKIFYFLETKKNGEYGIFQDDKPENRYSFKLCNNDLGFFINHIETKKFKGLKIN